MLESWFLYPLGLIMALAGYFGGKSIRSQEEMDKLFNSELTEWEIIKIRLAVNKVNPYRLPKPKTSQVEEEETFTDMIYNLIKRK